MEWWCAGAIPSLLYHAFASRNHASASQMYAASLRSHRVSLTSFGTMGPSFAFGSGNPMAIVPNRLRGSHPIYYLCFHFQKKGSNKRLFVVLLSSHTQQNTKALITTHMFSLSCLSKLNNLYFSRPPPKDMASETTRQIFMSFFGG